MLLLATLSLFKCGDNGNTSARTALAMGKLLGHCRLVGRRPDGPDVRGCRPDQGILAAAQSRFDRRLWDTHRHPFRRRAAAGGLGVASDPADDRIRRAVRRRGRPIARSTVGAVRDRRRRVAAVVHRNSQRLGHGRLCGGDRQGPQIMIHRRQMLKTLLAASLLPAAAPLVPPPLRLRPRVRPLRSVSAAVDWPAVRDLFPLASDWTHLSSFLFVSPPKPVADAIDHFRRKLDSDAMWIEIAAFTDAEGRPFAAVKRALADYTGGSPTEIAFTSNTTSALAMAYHGLRIRADQEILTSEHDHYSHHESIRFSAARSGASVRYIPLYDSGAL